MAEKTKNHFVPNFILTNFSKINDQDIPRISFLQKSTNKIVKNIPSRTQCQERYFYSKKKITDLLENFHHIELNPLFDRDKTLEENLDENLERRFANICKNLKSNANSNIDFIKEYFIIQFLRTKKFKESIEEIRKIEKFPNEDFTNSLKEKIINQSKFPKEIVENLLNTPKYKNIISEQTSMVKDKFERFHDFEDRHTLEIISKRARDDFFDFYGLFSKNMTLLINDTSSPFILSDWGILLTKLVKEYPNNTKIEEYEFYLSVSPQIMILFSNKNDLIENITEEHLKEINHLLLKECFDIIYSSNEEILNSI